MKEWERASFVFPLLHTFVKKQTHIIKPTESHGGTSLKNVMDCTESLTLADVRFGTLSR